MMLHPFVVAMLVERGRRELATTVRAQHAQLVAALNLCCRLLLGDASLRLVLGGEEYRPHEPAIVVNEQEDVATPAKCRVNRAAEVPVDQLQGLLRPVPCSLREGQTLLLPGKTCITQLVGVHDVR